MCPTVCPFVQTSLLGNVHCNESLVCSEAPGSWYSINTGTSLYPCQISSCCPVSWISCSFGSIRPALLLSCWVGEMAQWLRALAALAEDLGSVPSTHMEFITIPNSYSRGSVILSDLSAGTMHTYNAFILIRGQWGKAQLTVDSATFRLLVLGDIRR